MYIHIDILYRYIHVCICMYLRTCKQALAHGHTCVERARTAAARKARPIMAWPCSQKVRNTTAKSFLRKMLNWKMHPKA